MTGEAIGGPFSEGLSSSRSCATVRFTSSSLPDPERGLERGREGPLVAGEPSAAFPSTYAHRGAGRRGGAAGPAAHGERIARASGKERRVVRSLKAILLGTDRRPGEGMSAGWWGVSGLSCAVAGIGGLVKGIWWAAVFLVPAVFGFVIAVRRAREGDI